jgi:hypothetical protein
MFESENDVLNLTKSTKFFKIIQTIGHQKIVDLDLFEPQNTWLLLLLLLRQLKVNDLKLTSNDSKDVVKSTTIEMT